MGNPGTGTQTSTLTEDAGIQTSSIVPQHLLQYIFHETNLVTVFKNPSKMVRDLSSIPHGELGHPASQGDISKKIESELKSGPNSGTPISCLNSQAKSLT